jgi:mycothiol synthase
LRRYRPEDLDAIVTLLNDAGRDDSAFRAITREQAQLWFGSGDGDLTRYGWVAERDGNVVGWVAVWAWPRLLAEGRADVVGGVLSAHRRQGIGRLLLAQALHDAQAAGARFLLTLIPAARAAARTFLEQSGFAVVRHLWRLRLDRLPSGEPPAAPPGLRIAPLRPGEDLAPIVALHNRAFANEFGHHDLTAGDLEQRFVQHRVIPSGIAVAWEGERAVGYCACVFPRDPDASSAAWVGAIDLLAIDPQAQGRGLGAVLLRHGLTYLQRAGCTAAELSVDGANERALRVYERVGFRVVREQLVYRRDLLAGGEPARGAAQ